MTAENGVLVGYGGVGTKSSEVSAKMTERLAANVRALLDARGLAGPVDRRWSRAVVAAGDHRAAETFAVDSRRVGPDDAHGSSGRGRYASVVEVV